jgi:hypothetical protein
MRRSGSADKRIAALNDPMRHFALARIPVFPGCAPHLRDRSLNKTHAMHAAKRTTFDEMFVSHTIKFLLNACYLRRRSRHPHSAQCR